LKSLPWLAVVLVLAPCRSEEKAQIPPASPLEMVSSPHSCQSIVHGHTDGKNNIFLKADVPAQGKFKNVMFRVRQGNKPWMDCQPGTTCNGAILPQMGSGSSDKDGALNFAAEVRPQGGNGFTSISDVRLVVNYDTEMPNCLSQTSFTPGPQHAAAQILAVPAGKGLGPLKTYSHGPGASDPIKLCDDWINNPNGKVVNGCRPEVQFTVKGQPNDPVDGAPESYTSCSNGTMVEVVCRTTIQY